MNVRRCFERAVEDLGADESATEEALCPRVGRRMGPLFRRAGVEFASRAELITFAILHRTWEAQRLYLESLAEVLDQAERDQAPTIKPAPQVRRNKRAAG